MEKPGFYRAFFMYLNKFYSFSFLLITLSAATVHAEVYKWVDENGKLHFSDRPRDARAEQVELAPVPFISLPGKPHEHWNKQQRALKMYEDDRKNKLKEAAKNEKIEQENKTRCAKLKRLRGRYDRSRLLYEKNKDGTKRYLSEAERKKEEADLNKALRRYCK